MRGETNDKIKEENGRFYVYNTAGTKKLTPLNGYATREEAKRREQQIEGFENRDQTITARRQQQGLSGDQMTSAQEAKVAKVLKEFEAGTLRSSSGQAVTSRRQALAIALSEAGVS